MIALLYHRLHQEDDREEKAGREETVYSLSAEHFEQQMGLLCRGGFRTVLPSALVGDGGSPVPRERAVAVTFDDGHRSHYDTAYPILSHCRMAAAFFVTAGWIESPGHLTWDQIREMDRNGMMIGSHTLTHPDLTRLDRKAVEGELTRSKKILEDGLGKSVDFLSIPLSRYDPVTREIAQEAGYVGVFTGDWKPGFRYQDRLDLRRLGIKGSVSLSDFRALVEMKRGALVRRHLEVSLKSFLKKGLGAGGYGWVRRQWMWPRG